jgi:Kelch motif
MPWTEASPLKDPRWALAAVDCAAPSPESGFRVYAIGGGHEVVHSAVATVEAYDPSTQACFESR